MSTLSSKAYTTTSDLKQAVIPGRSIEIQYENAEGLIKWRNIDVLRVYQGRNSLTYIRAYCHYRNKERTFRLDRICDWIDTETGVKTAPGQPDTSRVYQETVPAEQESASPQPAETPEPAGKARSRGAGATIVAMVAGFIILYGLWSIREGDMEPEAYSSPANVKKLEQEILAILEEPEQNEYIEPVKVPSVRYARYRGYTIRVDEAVTPAAYTVPALGITFLSLRDSHTGINITLFRDSTGISDARVLTMYTEADRDVNGHLSWPEIEAFQEWLYRTFEYKNNDTALRPDQFIDAGGGDCEDWALVTCGLLRFWGWNSRVASFSQPSNASAHAITLVWSDAKIGSYSYYYFSKDELVAGKTLKAGYYIPIDYNTVGNITNAMAADWPLRNVWEPEEIYGWVM